MDTVIFTRDSAEVWVIFILMELIFITLWVTIYFILRKPQYRRSEYLQLWNQPCSRNCSLVISTAIAFPFIIYMYIDCWQHFYSISRESDRLYVHYYFPSRTKTVDSHNLQISTEVEVRRGAQFRIKLIDNKRHEYTSQLLMRRELDDDLALLKQSLKEMSQSR